MISLSGGAVPAAGHVGREPQGHSRHSGGGAAAVQQQHEAQQTVDAAAAAASSSKAAAVLTRRQRVAQRALEHAAVPQPPGHCHAHATREQLIAQINDLRARVRALESRLDVLGESQKRGWSAYFRVKEGGCC